VPLAVPPEPGPVATHITEEAAITARPDEDFRVDLLVREGDRVAQGAPVLRSRRYPEIVVTAPMAARIATIDLGPGRRLSQMVFFREPEGGRHEFKKPAGGLDDDSEEIGSILLESGLWQALRSRPFGRVPTPDERPTAIMVMALDTRPDAPDPRVALEGRLADLSRGLRALIALTPGPVFLCQDRRDDLLDVGDVRDRLRLVKTDALHPWGLAGFQIHRHCPALSEQPVWDIHVEDVAAIGTLLTEGLVDETRHVRIAGPAMRQTRLVRCQPGADMRGLSRGHVQPGPHAILSGSALDGHEARWLAHRDRQVTVIDRLGGGQGGHWLLSALRRASRPVPVIPTAALEQSLGGALPAAALVRALSSGDSETAVRLGALSLVEEDLTLADYVTCAEPRLSELLKTMLQRIEREGA
jgi:Na+-transporting NADH:ubiquinone oxidoreductase subunit A